MAPMSAQASGCECQAGNLATTPGTTSVLPDVQAGEGDQVHRYGQDDDGEDHDPHHVDEVPVETDQLDGLGSVLGQLALGGDGEQRQQHEDADGHVGAVEPGEHEEAAAEQVLVQGEPGPVEDGELVDLAP